MTIHFHRPGSLARKLTSTLEPLAVRRLQITVRDIAGDDSAACDDAWSKLRDAVGRAGGRAWRFRSSRLPDRVIEFIEWSDPYRPLHSEDVRHGLDRLERIAPGSGEEWEEAPAPGES